VWTCSNKVHALDLKNNTWQQIGDLNMARDNHSSCSVGEMIFVVCGDQDLAKLNSIEMLDYGYNKESTWQLIKIEGLTPRISPLVSALTDVSILIMGGFDGREHLSDAFIYDFCGQNIRQVIKQGSLKFMCQSNTIKTANGEV